MSSVMDLSGDKGVIKELISEGRGDKPIAGSKVFGAFLNLDISYSSVHFKGTIEQGKEIFLDTTTQSPFTFILGEGILYSTWFMII